MEGYSHKQLDLLDTETPRLLEEGLYYPDGQILDEVHVYGSSVQSKSVLIQIVSDNLAQTLVRATALSLRGQVSGR